MQKGLIYWRSTFLAKYLEMTRLDDLFPILGLADVSPKVRFSTTRPRFPPALLLQISSFHGICLVTCFGTLFT